MIPFGYFIGNLLRGFTFGGIFAQEGVGSENFQPACDELKMISAFNVLCFFSAFLSLLLLFTIFPELLLILWLSTGLQLISLLIIRAIMKIICLGFVQIDV